MKYDVYEFKTFLIPYRMMCHYLVPLIKKHRKYKYVIFVTVMHFFLCDLPIILNFPLFYILSFIYFNCI